MLYTDLRITECLKTRSVYWYVGMTVPFTTLTGGTETVLTERFGKTTLITLRQTLTVHLLIKKSRRFTDCIIYRMMDTLITSTRLTFNRKSTD